MPILSNPKHEKFARLVANGATPTNAYVSAGYDGKGSAASANALLKNPKVSDRVAELQPRIIERAIEATAMSKADVIRELCLNVEKGRSVRPAQISASNQALQLIGKELGMFVDRKDITMRKAMSELTDEEVDALIADAERKQAGEATSGTIQ